METRDEPSSGLDCSRHTYLCCDRQPPSSVFHNGTIVTVDPRFRTVEAMAVLDGRIVSVGTNAGRIQGGRPRHGADRPRSSRSRRPRPRTRWYVLPDVAVQRTAVCCQRPAHQHPAMAQPFGTATVSGSRHRLILENRSQREAYADTSRREKPLRSRSRIGRRARRQLAPREGPDRDNFRDNLGDSRVPASRSLAYT